MGRYSSVQAYADSNSNMRSVSYEQATGSSEVKKGAVKAEKVSNPYGSTAGAGSGEFHVYRHARSREMERWKQMEEQEKQEKLNQEFVGSLKQAEEECLAKTKKNQKKRQRQKEAKLRKKNLQLSGVAAAVVAGTGAKSEEKKEDAGTDEFSYTPLAQQPENGREPAIDSKSSSSTLANTATTSSISDNAPTKDESEPPQKRRAT